MLRRPGSRRPLRGAVQVAVAAVVFLAACGDETAPEPADVAGTYTATQFVITPTGQSASNVLTAGGSLTLVLGADGSTAGTLVVPPSADPEGDGLEADMAGTFTLLGSRLTINQTADTFVRDVEFVVGDGRLTGEFVGTGGRVTLTLVRGS